MNLKGVLFGLWVVFRDDIKPKITYRFHIRLSGLLNVIFPLSLIVLKIFLVKDTVLFQGHYGVCRITNSARMLLFQILITR